jgi:hypothetical protein
MKLILTRTLPKGRVPHHPTKVEPPRGRYDRRRAKQETLRRIRSEDVEP